MLNDPMIWIFISYEFVDLLEIQTIFAISITRLIIHKYRIFLYASDEF